MTNDASSQQARFEFLPGGEREPATVRAAGDIDLTNVGQFQAALDQAAAISSAITADLTAVTYCDSATIRACSSPPGKPGSPSKSARRAHQRHSAEVSGLDQIATVVTLD